MSKPKDSKRKDVFKTTAAKRRRHRPKHIDPHQAYSIPEACAATDTSRSKLYDLIKHGHVAVSRLGKRCRIPGAEIIRLNGGAA